MQTDFCDTQIEFWLCLLQRLSQLLCGIPIYLHGFWIDNDTFLPAKMTATSTEGDIFDIQLLDIKVNKKIKNAVFKLETPNHFSQNRAPLKKK